MAILNTLPVRVPIGSADSSGSVLMSPEFARLLSGLLERVGGIDGSGTADLQKMLDALSKQVTLISTNLDAVEADVAQEKFDSAKTSSDLGFLQIEMATDASLVAQVIVLSRQIQDLQAQMAFSFR